MYISLLIGYFGDKELFKLMQYAIFCFFYWYDYAAADTSF